LEIPEEKVGVEPVVEGIGTVVGDETTLFKHLLTRSFFSMPFF